MSSTRSVRVRKPLAALALSAGAIVVSNSTWAKNCDSACLQSVVAGYLSALPKHDAAKLSLAAKVKYTENGRAISIKDGLWKSTTKIGDYREIFVDAATGTALVIAVIDEGATQAIIATRLKAPDGKVSEIESIIARRGSHPLFTPELLTTADQRFFAKVDPDTRVPRQRMIEIANSYFDGIEHNSSKGIPAIPDCDRYENGTKTTFRTPTSGNCAKSADNINYIKAVRDRRYFIVDEATGVVACTIVFDIPGGDPMPAQAQSGTEVQLQTTLRQPRMLLLTEIFKIEGGNIARIQAVMHNLPHGAKSGWEKN